MERKFAALVFDDREVHLLCHRDYTSKEDVRREVSMGMPEDWAFFLVPQDSPQYAVMVRQIERGIEGDSLS